MSSIHNYKYINKNNYELYKNIMENCDIVIKNDLITYKPKENIYFNIESLLDFINTIMQDISILYEKSEIIESIEESIKNNIESINKFQKICNDAKIYSNLVIDEETETYNKHNEELIKLTEEIEKKDFPFDISCPICQEKFYYLDINNISLLDCSHILCNNCYFIYLEKEQHKNKDIIKCPICMSKISPELTQISSKLIKRLMLEHIGGQENYDKIYKLTDYINNYVGIDATKLDILLLEKEIIIL